MALDPETEEQLRQLLQRPEKEPSGLRWDIVSMSIEETAKRAELRLRVHVTPPGGTVQHWELLLDYYEKSDFTRAPDFPVEEFVSSLGFLIRVHVSEWWYTKDHEAFSARMGRRIR